MLKRIAISGLGPHTDFSADLDPKGTNTFAGPSEVGKTLVLEALTFALWGRSSRGKFPVEAIADGAQKAVIELGLEDGRVIRRTLTRSRATTRTVQVGEEKASFETEDKLAAGLGDLGADPEALFTVLAPMAWVPLVDGNARPFRDLLARVLPGGDVEQEVGLALGRAGFELRPGDASRSEKEVMESRKEARRQHAEATGRLQAARERLAAVEAEVLPEVPVADAALLERVQRWEAYDRQAGAAAGREQQLAAQQEWDRRRAEIGAEPSLVDDPTAPERAARARQALDAAMAQYQSVYARYQFTAMQLQPYVGATDATICPTCRRPGWEAGTMAYAQLQGMGQAVQMELAQAQAAHQQASASFEQANALAEQVRDGRSKREGWQRAIDALGPRPVVAEAPAGAEPPKGKRPSAEEAGRAREAQAAAAGHAQLAQRRTREITAATQQIAKEEQQVARLAAEADRLDALLEAVRTAPSAVAARQALALGDLGPVALRFGDNPAVAVLVDGRPWWLASRGRLIVADAWLRAALRRAIGMPSLLIVIDNVQDVKGQPIPDLGGPVLHLVTADGSGLRVNGRGPGDDRPD
jgi:hypothetical protein